MSMGSFVLGSVSVTASFLVRTFSGTAILSSFSIIAVVGNMLPVAILSMVFDCVMVVGLSVPVNVSLIMSVSPTSMMSAACGLAAAYMALLDLGNTFGLSMGVCALRLEVPAIA